MHIKTSILSGQKEVVIRVLLEVVMCPEDTSAPLQERKPLLMGDFQCHANLYYCTAMTVSFNCNTYLLACHKF